MRYRFAGRMKGRAVSQDRREHGNADTARKLLDAVRNPRRRRHLLLGKVLQREKVERSEGKPHPETAQVKDQHDLRMRGVDRETARQIEARRHNHHPEKNEHNGFT